MNKTELRSRFKEIRREITEREKKEEIITRTFIGCDEYRRCKTLFLFASGGSEASTDIIAETAFKDGKSVAYPVCSDSEGNMRFYLVTDKSQLIGGMYGLREPEISRCELIAPDKNTLVAVPGLAFDRKGFRLGYGKGYYDRYLSEHPCLSAGLAFDACVTDLLPADTYDKKVDILITDKKKYIFSITKEE